MANKTQKYFKENCIRNTIRGENTCICGIFTWWQLNYFPYYFTYHKLQKPPGWFQIAASFPDWLGTSNNHSRNHNCSCLNIQSYHVSNIQATLSTFWLAENMSVYIKQSVKTWNWMQNDEMECRIVKLNWLTELYPLTFCKQNGRQILNEIQTTQQGLLKIIQSNAMYRSTKTLTTCNVWMF